MNSSFSRLTALVLVLIFFSAGTAFTSEPIVVGSFDSRCVALAYYRQGFIEEEFNQYKIEYDEAIEAGDSVRMEELEDLGSSRQEMMHAQVFSNADIDEIIMEIWDDLPAIAEENEVDIIVSVWDVAYIRDGTQFVDVTDDIVLLFNPEEDVLELIEEVQAVPPIPIQMLDHQH